MASSSRCPCVARVGFGDHQGIYFRIHCLELLDCNECDHYAKRVVDTELLSAQCGSREPGLADCVARCGDRTIGVEFTSLPQQQLCGHAQKKVSGGGPLALRSSSTRDSAAVPENAVKARGPAGAKTALT